MTLSSPRLECIKCGARFTGQTHFSGCPACRERGAASNLRFRYDLTEARPRFLQGLESGEGLGIWRYQSLLPITDAPSAASDLLPGGTPLLEAPRLAARIGIRRLWVKDESRNPTWSLKDRSAALAAVQARALGARALIVASTGNAASAIAAAGARVGMPAVVLVAQGVDPIMEALTRSFGALVLLTPTKKDRWKVMQEAVGQWSMYPGCNFVDPPVGSHPYMADGYKTTGFEIWEQLGRRSPDWVFGPLGHADNLYGIHRAFEELEAMNLVDGGPRLGGGEVYGSLVDALENDLQTPQEMPIQGATVATSIATPRSTYQAKLAITESRGYATRVEDEQILEAHRLLAEVEGVLCEVTSATGLVALRRALAEGVVDHGQEVVLVSTSAGTKSLAVAPGLTTAGVPHGGAIEPPPLVTSPTEAWQVFERLVPRSR